MFLTILLTLLNVGLLAIPIGGTVGVLGGIDYHRQATGQTPLFTGGGDEGGDGSSTGGGDSGNSSSGNSTYVWDGDKPNATTVVGGTTISEYCQQYNDVSVNTTGQNYTLNPNQWGYSASEGGSLCLNITTNNNDTYATNTTAPKWSATWQYPEGSDSQPVHAYPNIMIAGDLLPVKLGKIGSMSLDVEWAYYEDDVIVSTDSTTSAAAAAAATTSSSTTVAAAAGATTSTSTTVAAAAAAAAAAATTTTAAAAAAVAKRSVNNVDFSANVAIDMFFDSDSTLASETSNATYEVMIWFAQFGEYTDPIGYSAGKVSTLLVESVNFTLYNGTNSYDQHVLTWVAEDAATTFSGSLLPLLTTLSTLSLDYYPTDSDYLGYFAFGSEAYYSNYSMKFDVTSLAMDIW